MPKKFTRYFLIYKQRKSKLKWRLEDWIINWVNYYNEYCPDIAGLPLGLDEHHCPPSVYYDDGTTHHGHDTGNFQNTHHTHIYLDSKNDHIKHNWCCWIASSPKMSWQLHKALPEPESPEK